MAENRPTHTITVTALAKQVNEMMVAQTKYFRTREPRDLEAAKQLEERVRRACREVLEQPTLF